ncbi:hypothetical protein B0T44_20485 [Nocardia donostiensis]|uniref:Uncharacterized protein n=1 Tax=Nocardia donostiensis TaxID=1538463 RepID=A0A1W0B702_9NOCA|nr:hypothetical protein B0T46_23055 [Nocardia donostiensis]OQS18305.1 hypothetical protein B0T44_20485 [Nocardia donostiensis]
MWGLPIVVLGGLQLVVMLDGTVVALAAGRHLQPQMVMPVNSGVVGRWIRVSAVGSVAGL